MNVLFNPTPEIFQEFSDFLEAGVFDEFHVFYTDEYMKEGLIMDMADLPSFCDPAVEEEFLQDTYDCLDFLVNAWEFCHT